MKKLLVLGGANMHCKIVKKAKDMGIYTIVTDYLPNSPAKRIADKSYDINITEIDEIVSMCKAEEVGGVLATHIDPCQKPYYEVCKRLGVPCYIGNSRQLTCLTDKNAFKELCRKTSVDVIETYDENNINSIEYPVLVKPACNRGSRAQTVCNNKAELIKALEIAKEASYDGKAIIERFMGPFGDFTITYMFVDGTPYLERIGDRTPGSAEYHMESVVAGTICPSAYYDLYKERMEPKVLGMLKDLEIKNGPVFFQGFIDGDKLRLYDPGYRFPGSEYESAFYRFTGVDTTAMMIEFAMTGVMNNKYCTFTDNSALLGGNIQMLLFPFAKGGIVGKYEGLETIRAQDWIDDIAVRYEPGEEVHDTHDVTQQIIEFNIKSKTREEMVEHIRFIQKNLRVKDTNGNDMIFGQMNPEDILITQTGGGNRK